MASSAAETQAQSAVSMPGFAEAVSVWARIGLLSFGGPAGQIALMHRELVDRRRWISEERFLHALNYCMLLPGPEAQQLATYIGWLMHGTRGGLAAGILFVLPGYVVILVLSTLYALFQETPWFGSVFYGLKAAVIAIVLEALVKIGRRALKSRAMVGLALASFVAIYAFAVPFPAIVITAALLGYVGTRLSWPGFAVAATRAGTGATIDRLIEDRGDVGAPRLGRSLGVALLWGGVWLAPVALASGLWPGTVYATLGIFFAKLAAVTFGGAYAALAYVAQTAVATFGWLKPGEMLDGLALAETTPGPLLMVLAFVGFEAAYRHPAGLPPLIGGILGGTLVTWVTFAPSFLWIFLGGPYVERLRGRPGLDGALRGVTAAVVGVILNLAIWFALQAIFREVGALRWGPLMAPWPNIGSLDPVALILALAAVGLLLRLKVGMIPTLAVCGAAGLAVKLLT